MPWQEKIPRILKINVIIFWLFVGIFIFFLQNLLIFIGHGTHYGLAAFGIYCFIISYAGFLPSINLYRLENLLYAMNSFIKLPKETIRTWYSSELENLFKLKRDFVIFSFLGPPLVLSLIHVTKFFQFQKPWFGTQASNTSGIIAFVIWCFLVSHHVLFVYGVVSLINKISKLPGNHLNFQNPDMSIREIGKFLRFVSVNLMIAITLIYLGVWLSPIPMSFITLAWISGSGIFVLGVFLIPQIKIHQIMVIEKKI